MTQHALAPASMGGLGDQGGTAAFATLLALTSDAVLAFDGDGTILLANDEAERLFRGGAASLVGSNVRLLFPPAATVSAFEGPLADSLPFTLDGESSAVTCEGSGRRHVTLFVRCRKLPMGESARVVYVLAADRMHQMGGEEQRLVDELSRANRRLSGTLRIVLGTLDSLDVGTLFSRVLDEITETVDAWGTLAYVAGTSAFRLRGQTASIGDSPVPELLSGTHPLVELASRNGQALRLRVTPLSRGDLRQGSVETRTVVDEPSGQAVEVPASTLPPFPSFVMVPVWFGGHVIALLLVGWRHAHRVRDDDARLLDAVAEYLSVQLAGAFAAFRAQHADALESLGTRLREELLAEEQVSAQTLWRVFGEAAEALDALMVPLQGNAYQRMTIAHLPDERDVSAPVDLGALLSATDGPQVADLGEHPRLASWLDELAGLGQGMLVAACRIDGSAHGCLLARPSEEEPFEDVDLAFVRRLAEDVCEVMEGERARSRDKHIAQALQFGMRNELQRVNGLSAQSRYSSATEAALVGGDFYDLIRLPEQRACVIMGDVSGKGVEAASVSSAVKTALGAYSWEGLRPARMVSLLNDFLLGFSRLETFATLFVGLVDLATRRLAYCSAGHPPALLVRAQSGELVTLGVQSGVVGAFASMGYRDGEVDLQEGDVLLLYTDGVTEARNKDGAFFGEDGLREAVARQVAAGFDGLCDRLIDEVRSFSGHALEDDVALVAVRVDGE